MEDRPPKPLSIGGKKAACPRANLQAKCLGAQVPCRGGFDCVAALRGRHIARGQEAFQILVRGCEPSPRVGESRLDPHAAGQIGMRHIGADSIPKQADPTSAP